MFANSMGRTHRERKEMAFKDLERKELETRKLYEQSVKDRNLFHEENRRLQEENRRLKEILDARGIRYPTDMAMVGHETSSSDSFSGSFRTPSSTSGTHSPPPLRDEVRYRPLQLPATGIDYSTVGLNFVSEYDQPLLTSCLQTSLTR